MPKRVSEICDRCHEPARRRLCMVTLERVEVNGHARHLQCWPAFVQAQNDCLNAIDACINDPARNTSISFEAEIDKFKKKVQQIKDLEFLMKAVNCTCKAARDELKSSNNPGLALAMGGHTEDFKSWPIMWQRMAFYAKVWTPKTEFTLNGPEVKEYKALIEKGIALEQARIERGGLPKALTLKYLRELLGNGE